MRCSPWSQSYDAGVCSWSWWLRRALRVGGVAALACAAFLLALAGWDLGRNGRLTIPERLATACVTGMFGAGLVVLKALLH